ncbi:hypothetical protein [Microbacterium sp. EST19A]|uniref:hypothetical protein n=1 Tax=Microbacterium sp. EST19A TaxID=2862681 RepID=UPI001CBAB036|nr:hypothetical protein [Microbacterium sp. EST19A]
MAQSSPPGCAGGVQLVGWDWDAVDAEYDERMEVHWGDFTVRGSYDTVAQVLTVVSVTAFSVTSSSISPQGPVLPSRCPEPAGGWRIVDESLATYDALLGIHAAATALDGYATSWIDRSEIPAVSPGTDVLEEMRLDAVHAGLSIVNVGVHGDPAAAEARLRQVWGGALCVFSADYTAAELDARLQEIMSDEKFLSDHQVMSAGPDAMTGQIGISVVHDENGELQQQMDDEYGPGAVVVSSVLKPL